MLSHEKKQFDRSEYLINSGVAGPTMVDENDRNGF
jgi:hypothetical protein